MNQTLMQLLALGFVLTGAVLLALYGIRYRSRAPEIRAYPVFRSLADEVGRVAEEGAAIHVAAGNGSLIGDDAMTSVASLQGMHALIDLSAAYDTPPLITTSDPTLYLLASDWMRRAYTRIGSADLYRPASVQFTAASPVAYAAMAATYLADGGLGSNIVLGAFTQEASLLTVAAERRNIHSAGGTTSPEGLGALYPALGQEQLVVGEDMFAGGAVVSQRSAAFASLGTQDILRWLVIAGIVVTALASLLGLGGA
ncbi:MAG TPA: hypothetical protein PKZ84_16515 [Anaerolineae bacterium]|nr:hypothetical protein [Anaerolineae bacterium]HQI86237.1 hypothetical protein [Anaerolineae bacterium]